MSPTPEVLDNHRRAARVLLVDERDRVLLLSVDELRACNELIVPRELADLLLPLLEGELPAQPIRVGV